MTLKNEQISPQSVIDECRALLGAVCEFSGLLDYEPDLDFRDRIRNRMMLAEVERDFGLTPQTNHFANHMKATDYSAISEWNSNKSISWSDDGRQPDLGERLYIVSFPCGPYTLHPDYPKQAFGEFFDKLKNYGPKYSDTANNTLYFTPEKAKAVHNDLLRLIDQAREIGSREALEEKAERLRKELAQLEAQRDTDESHWAVDRHGGKDEKETENDR